MRMGDEGLRNVPRKDGHIGVFMICCDESRIYLLARTRNKEGESQTQEHLN